MNSDEIRCQAEGDAAAEWTQWDTAFVLSLAIGVACGVAGLVAL